MVVMADETLFQNQSLFQSLIPKEILEVTEGMVKELQLKLYKLKIQDNAVTIANYILCMKHEVNISENYKISSIRTLVKLSNFINKPFIEITHQDFLSFLNSLRKPEPVDPLHKWIGTYNNYLVVMFKFFQVVILS